MAEAAKNQKQDIHKVQSQLKNAQKKVTIQAQRMANKESEIADALVLIENLKEQSDRLQGEIERLTGELGEANEQVRLYEEASKKKPVAQPKGEKAL